MSVICLRFICECLPSFYDLSIHITYYVVANTNKARTFTNQSIDKIECASKTSFWTEIIDGAYIRVFNVFGECTKHIKQLTPSIWSLFCVSVRTDILISVPTDYIRIHHLQVIIFYILYSITVWAWFPSMYYYICWCACIECFCELFNIPFSSFPLSIHFHHFWLSFLSIDKLQSVYFD